MPRFLHQSIAPGRRSHAVLRFKSVPLGLVSCPTNNLPNSSRLFAPGGVAAPPHSPAMTRRRALPDTKIHADTASYWWDRTLVPVCGSLAVVLLQWRCHYPAILLRLNDYCNGSQQQQRITAVEELTTPPNRQTPCRPPLGGLFVSAIWLVESFRAVLVSSESAFVWGLRPRQWGCPVVE